MSGISSQGVTISRGDAASPEVFTVLAAVADYSGPSADQPELDVSDLSSTAKEFIAGLIDNGEVTLSLHWQPDNATHVTMLSDFDAGTISNWRVTWSDASPAKTWTFPAFVKSFVPTASVDSPLSGDVTLRVTGAVTRA